MGFLTALGNLAGVLTSHIMRASHERRPAALSEIVVRADIERARTELRLGNVARCEALLAAADQRLGPEPPVRRDELSGSDVVVPSPSTGPQLRAALRGVILSLLAQSLRVHNRAEAALTTFRRAVESFSMAEDDRLTVRDHGDYGIALAAIGRDKEALRHLELAVASDGGASPEAARELARLLMLTERHPEAAKLADEILLASPADAEMHLLRAQAQRARHDPVAGSSFIQAGYLLLNDERAGEALAAFDEAEKLGAGVDAVAGLRAEALRLLGRHAEALKLFDGAIERDPTSPWLHVRRAAAFAAIDEWGRANTDVEHALAEAPDDLDVLLLAGAVRLAIDDPRAAQRIADRALSIDRGNVRAIELATTVRQAIGDLTGALSLLRAAGPEKQSTPALLRLHADLALMFGDRREAIDLLDRLCAMPDARPRDLFQYASALDDEGKLAEGLAVTGRGIEAWPDDIDLRLLHSELQLARGDTEASLSEARTVVTMAPSNAQAHLVLAAALMSQSPRSDEHVAEALQSVRRSEELVPDWAGPLFARAQILWMSGEFDEAYEAVQQTLDLDPRNQNARTLLADIHLSVGDVDKAEQVAGELLAEQPDDAANVILLARVLVAKPRYAEALELLTLPAVEAVRHPADRLRMLELRADVRRRLFRFADAAEDLTAATELAPDRVDMWIERAANARSLGDRAGAKEFALRACSIDGDDLDARYELAYVHLMNNEYDNAQTIADDLLGQLPDNVSVKVLCAHITAAQQPHLARKALSDLARAHPDDPYVAVQAGQLEMDAGEYRSALTILDRVADEPDAENIALRAEAHWLLDEPAQAIELATTCLAVVPYHPSALYTLGFALVETGEAARAVEVFTEAVAAYPDDPVARARLGHAYAADDKVDAALAEFDEAALAVPDNVWVLSRLAELLTDIGQFEQAGSLYQRVTAFPDADAAAAWAGLGWTLEHRDAADLGLAEQSYRRAVELDDDGLWHLKSLANVLHRTGRHEQANELYQQVLRRALARRAEHATYLSLAAWCSFKLGDLVAAARALYEATSAQKRTDSDHFDLALVHVCDGRIDRGVAMYESLIPLSDRDPHRRRGLLAVARVDLEQATADFPHLAHRPEIDHVLTLMRETMATLPPAPTIRVLDAASGAVGQVGGRAYNSGDG